MKIWVSLLLVVLLLSCSQEENEPAISMVVLTPERVTPSGTINTSLSEFRLRGALLAAARPGITDYGFVIMQTTNGDGTNSKDTVYLSGDTLPGSFRTARLLKNGASYEVTAFAKRDGETIVSRTKTFHTTADQTAPQ